MADFSPYFKVCEHWENNPTAIELAGDAGKWTHWGVTQDTLTLWYKHQEKQAATLDDIKNLTYEEAQEICKWLFWDKIDGDKIINQSIAAMLCDFKWTSGNIAVLSEQRILATEENVTVDGIAGDITAQAVNNWPEGPEDFFNKLKQAHLDFIDKIVAKHPNDLQFKNGWKNRVNSFKFEI